MLSTALNGSPSSAAGIFKLFLIWMPLLKELGNLGAKEEIFLGEENVVRLMIQNGTNVLRVKGTVTLMQAALVVLSVEGTTVGCIMKMPHLEMTAVRLPEANRLCDFYHPLFVHVIES